MIFVFHWKNSLDDTDERASHEVRIMAVHIGIFASGSLHTAIPIAVTEVRVPSISSFSLSTSALIHICALETSVVSLRRRNQDLAWHSSVGLRQNQDQSVIKPEHWQNVNIFQAQNTKYLPILANVNDCCLLTNIAFAWLQIKFERPYDKVTPASWQHPRHKPNPAFPHPPPNCFTWAQIQ